MLDELQLSLYIYCKKMAKQSKDVEGLSFFFFFFQNIIVSKSILGTSIAREKNGEPTHVLDCITPGGATKKIP